MSRAHLRWLVAALAFVVATALPVHVGRAVPASSPAVPGAWLRPVDGPLVHAFEEPSSVYGAGHRGADLGVPPGTAVRAAGDGEVTFAGPVAGTLHVTVLHAHGLRTSYSFLSSIAVHTGDPVQRGEVLGTTGGTNDDHDGKALHLGLRTGDRYLDPMLLFAPVDLAAIVRLAPADPPVERPWTLADERRELSVSLRLPVPGVATSGGEADAGGCGGGVPVIGGIISAGCDVAEWLGDHAPAALDAGLDVIATISGIGVRTLDALRVPARVMLAALRELPAAGARALARTPPGLFVLDLVEMGRRFAGTVLAECSTDAPDADGTGGSAHRVMVVAGIGSSGGGDEGPTVDLDVSALGYHRDEGEVRWFSYAGDGRAYRAADTHEPLDLSAQRLYTQLQAMQREQPGREVDLVAHSQGGVVVDVFLARYYRAADPTLPPLGTVVTVSSPHEGAPLATAADRLRAVPHGDDLLHALGQVPGVPAPDSPAVHDLSERSSTVAQVQAAGVPEHFDVTTIGATEDVIVPANHISLSGARETVVGVTALNEHSAVLRDADGLRAIRAGLEGRAPPCVSIGTALRSAAAPVVISRIEHPFG